MNVQIYKLFRIWHKYRADRRVHVPTPKVTVVSAQDLKQLKQLFLDMDEDNSGEVEFDEFLEHSAFGLRPNTEFVFNANTFCNDCFARLLKCVRLTETIHLPRAVIRTQWIKSRRD